MHSFDISVCTCWKHFVMSIDRSSSTAVVTLYENGAVGGLASPSNAPAISDTQLTVSPVQNFRNLEIWNFVVNSNEAAEIFRKGIPIFDKVISVWRYAPSHDVTIFSTWL